MTIKTQLTEASRDTREWIARDYKAGQDAAKALSRALNGGTRETITLGLIDGLTREHRYLQSEVVWSLLTALAELGGPELSRERDARNEHAMRACEDVRQALQDRLPLA